MNKKGFTLVEVLAVVILLGVLTMIAVPAYSEFIKKANQAKTDSDESAIKDAVLNFLSDCTVGKVDDSLKSYCVKNAEYDADASSDFIDELKSAQYLDQKVSSAGYEIAIKYDGVNFTYDVSIDIEKTTAEDGSVLYRVKFNLDGGTAEGDLQQKVKANETITNAPTPTRVVNGVAYTFKGWTLNGADFDINTPINSNIVLVAKWEIPQCRVTFTPNNGTTISPVTLNCGETLGTRLPTPTKNSNRFNGWYSGSTNITSSTPITASITIAASWTKFLAGLKINKNGTDQDVADYGISNLQVGDLVKFQTEQFYVVNKTGTTLSLLTRYLLNVGPYTRSGSTVGLQNNQLGEVMSGSSIVDYTISSGSDILYGAVPFSSSVYWWKNGAFDTATYPLGTSGYPFVYGTNSNLYQYISGSNGYVNKLRSMGLTDVVSGTLLSVEDVSSVCNYTFTTFTNLPGVCPEYVYETRFFLGSASDDKCIFTISPTSVKNAPRLTDYYSTRDNNIGVRPVINLKIG